MIIEIYETDEILMLRAANSFHEVLLQVILVARTGGYTDMALSNLSHIRQYDISLLYTTEIPRSSVLQDTPLVTSHLHFHERHIMCDAYIYICIE